MLAVAGGLTAAMALYRWKQNELAMRQDKPLQYTSFLLLITLFIMTAASFALLYILL